MIMREHFKQPEKNRMAGDLVFQLLDSEGNIKKEQREHNLLKDAWYRGGFFHTIGYATRTTYSSIINAPAPFNYLQLISDDDESSPYTLLSKGKQLGYASIGDVYTSSSTTRGTINLIDSNLDTTESLITGKCKLKYVFDFPSPCANGTITKVGFSHTASFNAPAFRANSGGTYLCPNKTSSSSRFYKVGNYLLAHRPSNVWVVYDSTGKVKYEVTMGSQLILSNDMAEPTTTVVKSYNSGNSSSYVYTLDLTTGQVTQSETTYNLTNISNIVQMSDGTWMCGYYNGTQPWYTFDIETMTKGEVLDYSNSVATYAYSYQLFPVDLDGVRHYCLWSTGASYSGSVDFYFIREDSFKTGGAWSSISSNLTVTSPLVINNNLCTLNKGYYSYTDYMYGMLYPFLATECVLSEPITKEEGDTLRVVYEISYDI